MDKQLYKKIILPRFHDSRGSLVPLEGCRDVPFEIKRIYYIYDTGPGISRGHHAHYNLKQLIICVSGSCKLKIDDGKEAVTIGLKTPEEGILITDFVWRELFDFSQDCVLLVLASEIYSSEDYINTYEDFKTIATGKSEIRHD